MNNIFFPVGGGNEIGASCYLIQLNGERILIDSGIRFHSDFGYPRFDLLYAQDLLDGLWELSAILISHGHIDHIGSLPKVVDEATDVPVYTTPSTKQIMGLQFKSLLWTPKKEENELVDVKIRLFNEALIEQAINRVIPKGWNESIEFDNFRVTFFPAGHILGASMIYIESESCNVLFTGDFTSFDQMTVPRYRIPEDLDVDLLITEATYGYQDSGYAQSSDVERENFASKIEQILNRGGIILIPAFAIGRSQEVILTLRELVSQGSLSPCPIYVDGLAQAACDLYEENQIKIFNGNAQKAPANLSRQLDSFCGVIIASSGMLAEGSASAKYAEKILPNSRNAILFSGYLDEESPGGNLNRLQQNARTSFQVNRRTVPINAEVSSYRLSAHSDSEGILALIEKVSPRKVVFVHGDPQYGTKINVYRETFRRFGASLEIYQSNNGIPIYF